MTKNDILIIGVIYNTFTETLRYVESLAAANTGNITLVLVDNSSQLPDPGFLQKMHYVVSGENTGYFGGARKGLAIYMQEYPEYPRWILVTNVDIAFTPDFFRQLEGITLNPLTGIVAPAIISQRWKTDYNPQLMKRPPKSKIIFYKLLYSNYLIQNIYFLGSYFKRWLQGKFSSSGHKSFSQIHSGTRIYAPHGSCLVFAGSYFLRGGTLNLPHFLFGEEIVLAETIRNIGLEVIYHPELVIHDYEHASTGFLITPETNRYYRESIRTILEKYYN
jgi:GT2 family glycosyltransferase